VNDIEKLVLGFRSKKILFLVTTSTNLSMFARQSIVVCVFLIASIANAQQKVEQITFSSRVHNPVKIEVIQNRDKFEFYAVSETYYPCRLELEFTKLMNLSPPTTRYSFTITHGTNRLFSLIPHMADQSIDYSYSFRYTLGDPRATPDPAFPYLIPVANGSKVVFYQSSEGSKIRNSFSTDSVFAMRKGIITAMPVNDIPIDRLFPGTIEVLHPDGTVAVYRNIDPKQLLVKVGQKVFAGMPLGIVEKSNPLVVNVFVISPTDSYVRSFNHKYAIGESETIEANYLKEGSLVLHPESVVLKEMSKSEIKRAKKGKN
jgi:hypothetical protein